jgi:RNA polymerase sigma-70 factor (ECF subfamily)
METLTFDPCAWTNPEAPAPARELSRSVQGALSALPPQFRAVVELVDLEGLAYRDAAEKLHVPVGTVMSRLFRGRRLLARAFEAPSRLPEAA